MQKVVIVILIIFLASVNQASSRSKKVVETENKNIFAISFSEHGEILAIGDGTAIKMFSIKTLSLLQKLENGHASMITALLFSSDSTIIVSGDMEGRICIWDLAENVLKFSFFQTADVISSLSLSPDSRYLAAGTTGNQTLIYDLAEQKLLKELIREDDVLVVKYHPEGKLLASAGADGKIFLYNTDTWDIHQILEKHKSWIRALDVGSDGLLMISGDDTGRIIKWRLNSQGYFSPIETLRSGNSWVSGLSFFTGDMTFVVANIKGKITIRTKFYSENIKSRYFITAILFQPNKNGVIIPVIATRGNGVIVYGRR
jgi:WD40 repeat protein